MANITINNENTTFNNRSNVIGVINEDVKPGNDDEKSANDTVKDVAGSVIADVISGGVKKFSNCRNKYQKII